MKKLIPIIVKSALFLPCTAFGNLRPYAVCIYPSLEGELKISMSSDSKFASVTLSGVHEFETKVISSGPVAQVFEYMDYALKSRFRIIIRSNGKSELQRFVEESKSCQTSSSLQCEVIERTPSSLGNS